MEQYDVYGSRSGLGNTAVSIPRSHGKLKRDKADFMDDGIKLTALKIPRQSPPQVDSTILVHPTETSAMSVLPRLLRTMANGSGRDTVGIVSTTANGNGLTNGNENGTNGGAVATGSLMNDTDSSSSSSSFISTPSSSSGSSSLISFLSPGQLAPVAAMAAAAALSAPTTTASINETSESSGLVTLATASSLIEKEWLARAAFANEITANTITSSAELPSSADLVTLSLESNSEPGQDSSPPLLFKTITTSSHPQINGSTPVTRAVLNVQSLAAFIRETQKQCSSRSAPPTPLELPLNSMFPVSTTEAASCTDSRVASPAQLPPSSAPTLLSLTPMATQSASADPPGGGTESTMPPENNSESIGTPQAAFISLQPAPGSLLSPSDLQQLMTSGEFMSSAARQTLLGQSADGSTRQLYLLVPSDCPVIMSRASTSQAPSAVATGVTSPPLLDSSTSTAPILEAISPGVEPDENCAQLPSSVVSTAGNLQPVTLALPQLAGAVLAPMSSTTTALSTLIAGLEARNQPAQQSRYPTTAAVVSSSPSAWSGQTSTVQTTDSTLPGSPRVRIPLHLPRVSLSDHNLVADDQATYSSTTGNGVSNILGSVKSDPDMYTPNGHPYASLVDDGNRFRSYPTYSQNSNRQLSVGTARPTTITASSAANATFYQSELPANILVPQPALATTPVTNENHNGEAILTTHINPQVSIPRANNTFASAGLPVSIASTTATVSTLLPANSKDDCRRTVAGSLLTATNNGRGDQNRATYLEHINPESKDIRRRVSHNEVERRRRDRINTWISELYKLLPPDEQAKSQYQSKGIVLKRVCEYFQNVDSMLKAANAAVEQTRVENGLLRQRVRELQQENQLLSASLQLGAAAAAAQLKHRQPQAAANLHSSPGEASATSEVASATHLQQEERGDPSDYPASVTVFTVGSNAEYSHGGNFNQVISTCTVPAESATTTSFAAAIPNSISSSPGVFVTHSTISSTTSTTPNMLSSTTRPLPLPSLDLVANHSDSRTE
ncbi:unnamed protein product [Calicophoron daubneyi]|uniref:BHLH domain-containing protein n=1 Tax=Calicophoron daubneyi TaxID=300641 RepID=A0AAV2SWQ5_CALDB